MTDCSSRWLRAILVLAVALGWQVAYAGRSRDVHPIGTSCTSCHLSRGPITQQNAGVLVGSQQELCADCHPGSIEVSHPAGFAPLRLPPPEFPLDRSGNLSCSSCHAIHGDAPGYLRTSKRGRDFCISCHDESFFERMADGGNSLVVSGHVAVEGAPGGPGPDAFSLQCMTCHLDLDGDLGVSLPDSGLMRHGQTRGNHPVGVLYEPAMRYGSYRSPALLPEEILLPEGKVSCVSCHRGYSEQHGKVVFGGRGSLLCYGCHDL